MIHFYYIKKNIKGSMLVITIVLTGLFLIILLGFLSVLIMQQKLNIRKVAQAQALQIAEAGVNYYRWVLYHNHQDFCNQETCLSGPDYGPYGPYSYSDSAGAGISGFYELYITPPSINGSTIVNIESVGWVDKYPNIKRTLKVKCGIPSWSTYSWLLSDFVSFGIGSNIYGRIHSNSGIQFNDAVAHNLVTSSAWNYNDGTLEFGIHTDSPINDPAPDANNPHLNVPSRPATFMAGREFPIPTVSFALLDNYINETYNLATTSGMVLPKTTGNKKGYHITLLPDDTINIKIVNTLRNNCNGNPSYSISSAIGSETDFMIGTSTPINGIIFVKDHVWVDGTINGNRVTILAFGTPFTGNNTDININSSLSYSNYDGTDSIGLVAQRNINVGQYSDDNLRIDGALIAKEGRIGREAYGSCTNSIRATLTTYGSLASKNRAYFYHGITDGYQSRSYIFDPNSTFTPPPHFPTTGEYIFISWDEE